MIRLDITSNINRVKLELKGISDDVQTKATVRALNRAGQQTMTEASREIRKIYNIKAAAIRHQMRLQQANRTRLTATVRVYGKRIPLSEFSPSQTRRGVTVRVKKGGRALIRGAFLRTMSSGHRGVFVRGPSSKGIAGSDIPFRRGKGSRIAPAGMNDLPIAQLFSLSAPTMLLEKKVLDAVKKIARESFERNFRQQMVYLTRAR